MGRPRFPKHCLGTGCRIVFIDAPSSLSISWCVQRFPPWEIQTWDDMRKVTRNNHRWAVPENEKGTAQKRAIFVVDLSQSRYRFFWPYINQHIFLVLATPAFASPDATCPGTDSTSPFNKIIQWRLKEKDRNNNQSKLKQKTSKDHKFRILRSLPRSCRHCEWDGKIQKP